MSHGTVEGIALSSRSVRSLASRNLGGSSYQAVRSLLMPGQDDLRRLARRQQSTGEGWVDLPATPGLTPASGLRYTERGGRRPAAYSYRQRGQCRPRHTDSRFLHWGGWRWKFIDGRWAFIVWH